MLVGVSTHNLAQARAAALEGANYLGAGPTFPSTTKSFDAFPGLDLLRAIAAETRLPTFAIGGITAANLPDVLQSGIKRVAISAAVTDASDPASAVHDLSNALVVS
jgi:thiamine-phosphate pyrophosphorylase